MPYNEFTTARLKTRFGLKITERDALFGAVPAAPVSDLLRQSLARHSYLALRNGSEKARSEFLIAPILAEAAEQMRERATLFSGIEFNVDTRQGLAGFCDFLFTRAPRSIEIEAPVVSVVEAKKEDIAAGIPQCLAELVAAQIFNANADLPAATLYGIVTTGEAWKFLRLTGTDAEVDSMNYFLDQPEKIVGVILAMLQDSAAPDQPA